MIKKIEVGDLRPGMYVHDLNRDWSEHPFLRNRFKLASAQDVEKIADLGLRYVYIDTDKGDDLAPSGDSNQFTPAQTSEIHRSAAIEPIVAAVPIAEELRQARHVYHEAHSIVRDMLQDCRLGKQVALEQARPVVTAITESIFRNPDALISLLRLKRADQYTFQHSVAVGTLLISFCRALNIERAEIELAGMGGLLHDIGKMRIPQELLNKAGKLTSAEFEIVKGHVEAGRGLLESTSGISPISICVAAEHHERYDGSGYPLGLIGEQISRFGQMAAIVDVYDALTSNRVYHHGTEPTAVLKTLLEGGGSHFNTRLVHQFIRTVGIYPVGTLVKLESDELAVVVEQHLEDLLHPKVRTIFDARQRRFIKPRDYDLAKPSCNRRILSFEMPGRWRIEPTAYLRQ
ncbi:HD-GYP domain-containing protein [Methylococcaceae bacterium WWC4]|nr:HD-GYP domain-containing protein [Methylococcaceae bacterium WWC4]